MTEQGGARANKSGRVLESLVENVIRGFAPDVLELPWRDWQQTERAKFPALIRHVPYTTLYGTQGKSEFVLYLQPERSIRIECKWQSSSGSVDEKFPYMLAGLLRCEESEVIILVDGGGAKPQAVKWLRAEAERQRAIKPVAVMNMTEFTIWAQRGMQ